MTRYLLLGSVLLILWFVPTVPVGLGQETPPKLELEFKLLNPSIFGLDSTAPARPFGSSGMGFTFGSPGSREITLQIVTREVAVDSKAKLDAFLSQNGILPDTNAESFVYFLNPNLSGVREIAKGTTLQLPMLRIPTTEDEWTLPRQPVISLVLEPKLKMRLREDVDNFRSIVKRKKTTFVPEVVDGLNSIDVNLGLFYRDEVPSSREMLEQVKTNVATLDSILVKYSRKSGVFFKGPKVPLNKEDAQLFDLIKVDLQHKVEAGRLGNPDVMVEVRTLKEGEEVSNFIVCYSPEARYKANQCDLSFSEQSSPTEQPLPVATYMFWATKPGEASAASDVRRIQVRWRTGKLMTIDLSIK